MSTTSTTPAPLVSVAIPAWNAAGTLAQAITSVLAQTHRPLEVIVVDDGSTDGTWQVIESFGNAIRPIRQAHGGIAAARNAGLQAAQGEFIALMDHDDVCEPQRIAVQLRFLQQQPEVLMCGSEFSAFDANGPIAAAYSATRYSRCRATEGGALALYPARGTLALEGAEGGNSNGVAAVQTAFGAVYEELALGCFVHPPTLMFRRSVLEDAGLFDDRAGIMCDWDWIVKVARAGKVGHIDMPLLRFRLSPGQVSSSPSGLTDSLRAAHLICERDPALAARHGERLRTLFGGMYAAAADAKADEHPIEALSMLASSVLRYRHWTRQVPRTLFKVLMPAPLLKLMRGGRAGERAGR